MQAPVQDRHPHTDPGVLTGQEDNSQTPAPATALTLSCLQPEGIRLGHFQDPSLLLPLAQGPAWPESGSQHRRSWVGARWLTKAVAWSSLCRGACRWGKQNTGRQAGGGEGGLRSHPSSHPLPRAPTGQHLPRQTVNYKSNTNCSRRTSGGLWHPITQPVGTGDSHTATCPPLLHTG